MNYMMIDETEIVQEMGVPYAIFFELEDNSICRSMAFLKFGIHDQTKATDKIKTSVSSSLIL